MGRGLAGGSLHGCFSSSHRRCPSVLSQCSILSHEQSTESAYSRVYHEGKEATKKLERRLATALVVQDRGFDPPMAAFSLSWEQANRRHFACLASGCTGVMQSTMQARPRQVNRESSVKMRSLSFQPHPTLPQTREVKFLLRTCCSYPDSIHFHLLIIPRAGSVNHSFPWVFFAGTCYWLLHYCFSGSPSISHCRSSTRPGFDVS